MYAREYEGKKLSFEASGGLLHSSLVMQDKQTDSYWAIMKGEAIAGKFKGTELRELPYAQKVQWKDWRGKHPNTLVLSVNGREDVPSSPYSEYFSSAQGFRGTTAKDDRLPTKEPIFAFEFQGEAFAIPHKAIAGGKTVHINGLNLFLYRPEKAALFKSTVVYESEDGGFEKNNGKWIHTQSGCMFNPQTEKFEGQKVCPKQFAGFDTFWYTWSLSNPDTKLLD